MADENPFGLNSTRRHVSPGAESSLYRIESPSNHGEVELVDYMGGDDMVVRVATAGHGTGIFPERPSNRDFLRHLVAAGIEDPFRSIQLKLSFQMPIRAALAFVYDRSCSVNEYSGRYSEMINSARLPTVEDLARAMRDTDKARDAHALMVETRRATRSNYEKLLGVDFAKELARQGLGTNNDTRFYWIMDLANLADFVAKQRRVLNEIDPTRDYVEVVAEIARKVAPESWDSLMEDGVARRINLTMPLDEVVVDQDLNSAQWAPSITRRVVVPGMEEKLFVLNKFLDHGQFQAVDYMGDDIGLAQAARTSYGVGTKKLSEDRGLIRTLVRDAHTSPIEMARLAFESRTPVFTDPRQSARHRTLKQEGFMGYTPVGNLLYHPQDSEMKYQDRVNRQGRGKEMDPAEVTVVRETLRDTETLELEAVQRLRQLRVPEDLIREIKGVGFHTRRWRIGDTHNLGNYLRLRLDKHAQMEVREQARQVEQAIQAHTPIAYQAIRDYRIDGMGLSAAEVAFLQANGLPITEDLGNIEKLFTVGKGFLVKKDGEPAKLTREGEGFLQKLKRFRNL